MRKKLESSFIFAVEVLLIASPVYFLTDSFAYYRLTAIAICFVYVLFGMVREGTFISMLIVGEKWEHKHYSFRTDLVYSLLYTASFSTLLFSVWFPFDLLLINLLLIQLPTVLLTGTTLHGYLSGNIASSESRNFRHTKFSAVQTLLRHWKLY